MNKNPQRLELTWIGKGEEDILEPRILIENPEYSYGDENNENVIIHGDNLLALKALEAQYAGKVKCIYIDPPYNTGAAFEHYDDNVEHSIWLSLMKQRLELLHKLLSKDGSIWISIDAYECHYLKVLCDEVFGRKNFIDEVIWQRSYASIALKKTISRGHDAILIYAKNSDGFTLKGLPRSAEANDRYKNPDNDPRGVWKSGDLSVGPAVEKNIYPIITPSGRECMPPSGYSWRLSKERLLEFIADNRIWFGAKGANVPSIKRFLSEVKDEITAMTLWLRTEVGDTQEAKREVKTFNSKDVFATPKPERLIERVLILATNPGDLVLDSFLGSGTTAAVAHKMGRRYIGIELGEHAYTHCVPRLKQVVDGSDQGGISKTVEWKGGGGFRFYELAPTLLNEDENGMPVINPDYNAEMLAAAMALHEGFRYAPHAELFWKQGQSTETDFIYTTTQHLTIETLEYIHSALGEGETLLICCCSHQLGLANRFPNITIKRIPRMLLGRCVFDAKKNYNLNLFSLPEVEALDDNGEDHTDN